ncbi:MAG TPA: SDR family NAD(P)-dependent oxidoreductase [Methylomirabilota bacterium]|nr:SDR family NAD(P)-dependent oxidoreductase [Methylomirabilota bacterium]
MRLHGKTAVVTGGGRGIGRAIALALVAEGAGLLVASDVEAEVQAVAREAETRGGWAVACRADVTRLADMETMAARAVEAFGALDILVTCAGVAGGGLVAEQPEADWTRVIDVNLNGTYRAIRAALPHMMRQGSGRIITISSIFGRVGGYGFVSAYAASKHGVIGLTRALATEVASQGYPGITVNAICPGYVRAGMGVAPQKARSREGGVTDVPGEEIFERHIKRRVPQRRMIEAEEVASAAVFLALPESHGLTGQGLNVDGGFVMS